MASGQHTEGPAHLFCITCCLVVVLVHLVVIDEPYLQSCNRMSSLNVRCVVNV